MKELHVRCPRCGTEFVTENDVEMKDIPKAIEGNYFCIPKSTTSSKKETNNIERKKENDTMENMMMNGMDMEKLAKMVAEQINTNTIETKKTNVIINTNKNGNGWAKNSKYYGEEICGYAYNPYLVRRWVQAQFLSMMRKYNNNVDKAIREEHNYMYSIEYIIREVEKLAMLQRRDKIAFEERRMFWSEEDIVAILCNYIDNCIDYIKNKYLDCDKNNKTELSFKVKNGRITVKLGKKIEVIENHRVVCKREFSDSLQEVLEKLEMKKQELIDCNSNYEDISNVAKTIKLIVVPGHTERVWSYKDRMYYKKEYVGYRMSKTFVEGYKKTGAYYTLKNLIMFDNFKFKGANGREAVDLLRTNLNCGVPAYVIYAMLKEAITENNYNIFCVK